MNLLLDKAGFAELNRVYAGVVSEEVTPYLAVVLECILVCSRYFPLSPVSGHMSLYDIWLKTPITESRVVQLALSSAREKGCYLQGTHTCSPERSAFRRPLGLKPEFRLPELVVVPQINIIPVAPWIHAPF